MPPLDGQVALVTGASGGIGAAVGHSLHGAGASVGLLDIAVANTGVGRSGGLTPAERG